MSGMDYRLEQSRLRAIAAWHDFKAAELRMAAAAAGATHAVIQFGQAVQASVDLELAGHPDTAELNVQLDGFYGQG